MSFTDAFITVLKGMEVRVTLDQGVLTTSMDSTVNVQEVLYDLGAQKPPPVAPPVVLKQARTSSHPAGKHLNDPLPKV